MSDKIKLSIIIPVASWDESWHCLIDDLKITEGKSEIIFVTEKEDEFPQWPDIKEQLKACNPSNITAPSGRAKSMNAGAEIAKGDFLWFLHADSRFPEESFKLLLKNIEEKPDSLHYFKLRYANDGPPLMFINELGANIRSSVFKVPFGDQGFCIKKSLFEKLGKYNEQVEFGEDHLFVWQAHQNKVPLAKIQSPLITSARKYNSYGWTELTIENQCKWIKQAMPEFKKLIKLKKS